MGLAGADGFFYFLGQPAGPDGFSLFVEASQAARTDFFYLPGRSDGADGFFSELGRLGRGFIFSGAPWIYFFWGWPLPWLSVGLS